ncbi:hypothetical protein XENOCAPTIV_029679 [Xenoophorus captivus]|uniref:Uncharacterized protein n=1 Tax=Xenoophorus captivus TaxID=1517983 RepID=A0ABV0QY72_9TELE
MGCRRNCDPIQRLRVQPNCSSLWASASALIYPPCSFAQGVSDCVFTHSKPLCFSLHFTLKNMGLHNPRFYENRHSPLRSGLHWFLKAAEKMSSLGTACPVSSFILKLG